MRFSALNGKQRGAVMRILLVDDELEFIVTLAERLSLRGIEADWTTKPLEAENMAAEKHYDVALLDVKMPEVSGINLKKRLQKKYPGMKFIFLTGHGSEESYRAGASEAGAEFYLLKPLQIEELVAKIYTALGKKGGADDE
jgi:DNA-binding response OmpR family regulator